MTEKLKAVTNASHVKDEFSYTGITLAVPPQPVGYWVIVDGFQVALYKKPTDEHIKNHYEMLGWEWRDAK